MNASQPLRLVPASRADRPFVEELSRCAFARFGDYDRILSEWMTLTAVTTLLAVEGETPVGFAMYAPKDPGAGITDLLAIAVEPGRQGSGIGRRLLQEVERAAREAFPRARRPALEASVAEDNVAALRLFTGAGYQIVLGEHGVYPRGQRSLAVRRELGRASG